MVSASNGIENPRKVFIGGLGQSTDVASFTSSITGALGNAEAIESAEVVIDKHTGKSRGFGFVVCKEEGEAERLVNGDVKVRIDGIVVEARWAMSREVARQNPKYDQIASPGKLFVGGLPEGVTEDDLKDYFSKFGPVRNVQIMYGKLSHKPRGFGFVYFGEYQQADAAVGQHLIGEKWCEAKRATPAQARQPRAGAGRGMKGKDGRPANARAGGKNSKAGGKTPAAADGSRGAQANGDTHAPPPL